MTSNYDDGAVTGRCGGVTLVELIAAVAVAIILLSLSVPAFDAIVGRHRVGAIASDLFVDLRFARHSAVTRLRAVHICTSRDRSVCSTGSDWGEGWILFVDDNHDRQRQPEELLLRIRDATPGASIRFASLDSTGISFRPDGSGVFNGTFHVCNAGKASSSKTIIFHGSGRPRFSDAPSACP